MKSDSDQEEIVEKEEVKTENDAENSEARRSGFRSYHLFPVLSLSLFSAIEIIIAQQSISGAVRNFIVVFVIAFAVMLSCGRWVTSRISFFITVLGFASTIQAFIPDFLVPIAAFAVLIAVAASSPYLGISCLMLFSALPFLITDRPYEYFLFYLITGVIGIALIYSRIRIGKFADMIAVFTMVYIILYTGLILLRKNGITPGLIIFPVIMLIADDIIMYICGYRYYMSNIREEEDLYLDVVDPEYPLLIQLKNTDRREYNRAIHTAHFTELFANEFGYDPVLMKGLGFYHRIGVLLTDDASLTMRTLALVMEQGFPEDIVNALKEYGEASSDKKISAEVSITIIVDTVLVSLMDEFAKGNNVDLNKFIDKTILGLFSGKDSLLKRSAIPYSDLEDIRKRLKGERIYYDFIR